MLPVSDNEGGKGDLLREKYEKDGMAVRLPCSGAVTTVRLGEIWGVRNMLKDGGQTCCV